MLNLSAHIQLMIATVLIMLMMVTRGDYFLSLGQLPDASWAIFFLVGIYLRSAWLLLGFFALSWALDFVAYQWGGVSDFCLTPAYIFLLPAYASLWLAGRWYAARYQFKWVTLIPLALSASVGLVLCELFSSGGFYFFSGRFDITTLAEYIQRTVQYFPYYVESFLLYMGMAVTAHIAFTLVYRAISTRNTAVS